MNAIAPPVCLVLSLLLLIAGFAVLATEKPQPSVELHRARVEADDQMGDALEQQLEGRRLGRRLLLGGLFGMAVIMAAVGFAIMRPPKPK